eukprot:scaffold25642_cov36-Phaeocystis_antarctica.AAC.1
MVITPRRSTRTPRATRVEPTGERPHLQASAREWMEQQQSASSVVHSVHRSMRLAVATRADGASRSAVVEYWCRVGSLVE